MKKLILLISLSLSLYAGSKIEQIYFKNACNSCHGIYAEGSATIPRLQGKKVKYLLKKLKYFQEGKKSSIMVSFAKSLDENQTMQMAKYLSRLKTPISDDNYDEDYDSMIY